MRLGWVLGVFMWVMLSGVWASAQAPPPPTPSELEDEARGEESSEERAALNLLEQAMEALARGDVEVSRTLLEELHLEFPGTRASQASEGALALLRSRELQAQREERVGLSGEAFSASARAELVIFQTLNGISVGAELCGIVFCDDPRLVVASVAGGAGLGLAGSLFATREEITPGHALALNSGTQWGFINGLLVEFSLDTFGGEGRRVSSLLLGGQLLGLAAGHMAYLNLAPTAGDVALMNTAGLWSGLMTLMVNGMVQPLSATALPRSLLVTLNGGLLGGAVLSKYYPVSRGRAFVIDAGGVVGALAGAGTYLIFAGGGGGPVGGFGSAAVGAAAGLGLSTYLTRGWDAEEVLVSEAKVWVSPTAEGRGATVRVGGRF